MELEGRVALITGGSRGLGKKITTAFFDAGASVVATTRKTGSDKTWMSKNGRYMLCGFDVTKSDDVCMLFQKIKESFGRLDVVVNNAGGAIPFGDFFSLSDDDWRYVYELNCMGPVRVCREAVPLLRKSPYGRIVNIASVSAHQPGMFNPHYSAAKAALLNINKHLANALAKDSILVNAICPGTLRGGGWDQNVSDKAMRLGVDREEAERIMLEEESKKVPLGRVGDLADVAELALFLASSRNNFITGTCINVDGGVTRSMT